MNVNASEFLTDEQKSQLGTALFEKILARIEAIEFKVGKLDFNQLLQNEVDMLFEQGEVYDNVDFSKVGKKLTKKLLTHLD